jgi:hypothetical protein
MASKALRMGFLSGFRRLFKNLGRLWLWEHPARAQLPELLGDIVSNYTTVGGSQITHHDAPITS